MPAKPKAAAPTLAAVPASNPGSASKKDGHAAGMKRFTNGHVTLTTPQMNALTELLASEERKRESFLALKDVMKRPRNPLAGDETPRTLNGDVVLNPNAHGTVANGMPLFDPSRPPRIVPPEKWAQGAIGVPDGKYNILGNSGVDMMRHSSQPKDLYAHAQEEMMRKSQMATEQRELSEAKRQAAAQRQQRQLAQQIETLRLIANKKQSEMDELRIKFGSPYAGTSLLE